MWRLLPALLLGCLVPGVDEAESFLLFYVFIYEVATPGSVWRRLLRKLMDACDGSVGGYDLVLMLCGATKG
ncbi:hypothetical protein CCP2SC5_250016 [Azospirillaceae bacterium]